MLFRMIGAIAGPYGRNFSQGTVAGILGKMEITSDCVYKLWFTWLLFHIYLIKCLTISSRHFTRAWFCSLRNFPSNNFPSPERDQCVVPQQILLIHHFSRRSSKNDRFDFTFNRLIVEAPSKVAYKAFQFVKRLERLQEVCDQRQQNGRSINARCTRVRWCARWFFMWRMGCRVGTKEKSRMSFKIFSFVALYFILCQVGSPSFTTSLKAWRSSGYFATGLQKFHDWPAQSSTVKARWWAVIVQATVGPHNLTASTAALVVACSSTMRSLGNVACSLKRCGRKEDSALRTWIFWETTYISKLPRFEVRESLLLQHLNEFLHVNWGPCQLPA